MYAKYSLTSLYFLQFRNITLLFLLESIFSNASKLTDLSTTKGHSWANRNLLICKPYLCASASITSRI